jgi:putative endonuclease
MNISKRQFGELKEQEASEFLQAKGLQLIRRNFSCRCGEIDLIMQENDNLVFVEVRYRRSDGYGSGLESITLQKQRKIIKAAQYYLLQNKLSDVNCRFDAVAITEKNGLLEFDWIKDAFWLKF